MEQLKSLLNSKEVYNFSVSDGANLLAAFAKKFPKTYEDLTRQSHYTEENKLPDYIKLDEVNKIMELMAIFYEQIFPIIADFFVKADELKKEIKLNDEGSPTSLLAARFLQLSFALGAMRLIEDVQNDPKKPSVVSGFELTDKQKEQFRDIYTLRYFSDLMAHELSATASDMLKEIMEK